MKFLIIIVAVASFSGCISLTPMYEDTTHTDDIYGFKVSQTSTFRLPTKTGVISDIEIFLQKFTKDEDVLYSLTVYYDGRSYLFIERGESWTMLIDGERMDLTTIDVSYGRLESASYRISPEQLKKISVASKIKVRLKGSRRWADAVFNEYHIKIFKQFYKTHIEKGDKNGLKSW